MSDDQTRAEKRTLRKAHKALLRALSPAVRSTAAAAATALTDVCEGRTGLFLSMPDEIDTGPLDDALREAGIARAYPVFDEAGLRFVCVPPALVGRELPHDRLSIPTPPDDWPTAHDLTTLIVPGLAFDKRGGRLGRGKGLYDRFVAAHPVRTIGLFFDEQELEACPMGPQDVFLERLFTPRRGLRSASRVLKERGG